MFCSHICMNGKHQFRFHVLRWTHTQYNCREPYMYQWDPLSKNNTCCVKQHNRTKYLFNNFVEILVANKLLSILMGHSFKLQKANLIRLSWYDMEEGNEEEFEHSCSDDGAALSERTINPGWWRTWWGVMKTPGRGGGMGSLPSGKAKPFPYLQAQISK